MVSTINSRVSLSLSNEQDSSPYPDRLSPTISVHAIMSSLAEVACNKGYMLGKINGTFIQMERNGMPVYIKCMGMLKREVLDIYPEYQKYVGEDGVLYCKLQKVFYGCIQASK
jgi:hypothetical protein